MEYNTSQSHLQMPEYGRNVQSMVDYLMTIEDPVQRKKNAEAVIEIMEILNPQLKNIEDYRHKLWDHLYRISDYKLEVDGPYPKPTREEIEKRPEPLTYPSSNLRNRHIGKNISQIMDRALHETDEVKKKGLIQTIGYYMKLAYSNWHHENVHDDMIREEIKSISNGALEYNATTGIKVANYRNYSSGNATHYNRGNFKNGGGQRNSNNFNKRKSTGGNSNGNRKNFK